MAVRTLRALTVDSLLLFVAQNDVAGEDREAIDGVLCENVILHRVTALKALRRAEQSRGFLGLPQFADATRDFFCQSHIKAATRMLDELSDSVAASSDEVAIDAAAALIVDVFLGKAKRKRDRGASGEPRRGAKGRKRLRRAPLARTPVAPGPEPSQAHRGALRHALKACEARARALRHEALIHRATNKWETATVDVRTKDSYDATALPPAAVLDIAAALTKARIR